MPNVVIAGAGYAGVHVARRLSTLLDSTWTILLLDRNPFHQLITRLPEVVGGVIAPGRARIPLAEILNGRIRFLQTEISGLDMSRRSIESTSGTISYDRLVLALGSVPSFLDVPGAAENGLVIRSVAQAETVRKVVQHRCTVQQVVRVAVVGAGYTGTEVAGELGEWNRRLHEHSSGIRLEIRVIAPDARLLPEGNSGLADTAQAVLRSKGVEFALNTPVLEVLGDGLRVGSGTFVSADLVIWAARSVAALPRDTRGISGGLGGRVAVDPYLQAVGHDGVFVAGDVGLSYDYRHDRPLPASAQLAVQEGAVIADNVAATTRNGQLREFRPQVLGEALSLGGRDGVAEVGGVVVSGRPAVAVKHAALIRYLLALGGPRLAWRYV